MKKRFVYSTLSFLALLGCQAEQTIIVPEETDDTINNEAKVFIATIEEEFEPGTKTSLDGSGNVLWSIYNQVSIFAGSKANEHYRVAESSEGSMTATLNKVPGGVSASGNLIDNNVAFYPYASSASIIKNESNYIISSIEIPAAQNYVADSFGNGAFPMTAVTSTTGDMNLKFKNVFGGLKLQLKGTATIVSISIKGNNNEILSGNATVTVPIDGVPSVSLSSASSKSVILNCSTGVTLNTETATSFIIALPPITMENGFTVIVTDSESKHMEITTTKSQTIPRSGLLKMPAVNYVGSVGIDVPAGAIDLGLSVLWATCNVGALNPEEFGGYYQWAGIQDVNGTAIGWQNCPYYDYDYGKWTKYNGRTADGVVDNLSCLEAEDDVATVTRGSNWRTPTAREWWDLEYTENCSWTWATLNGVNGYIVQSKIPGFTDNWIFLPAAGYQLNSSTPQSVGTFGCYWASVLYNCSIDARHAYYAYFDSENVGSEHDFRRDGHTVRPVWGENIPATSLYLNLSSITLMKNETTDLVATVVPGRATNKSIVWNSDDTSIATVSSSGTVTAVAIGETTISATTSDGDLTALCNVIVTHDYVDLGLPSGTLWATCNINAAQPEHSGSYFAWGATRGYKPTNIEPDEDYDYCDWVVDSGYSGVGNGSSKNGTENLPVDSSYDAARNAWGEGWRMPTKEDFEELFSDSNTTTTYESSGYRITSKANGNSIYLGSYHGKGSGGILSPNGGFWTSSCSGLNSNQAYKCYSNGLIQSDSRYCRLPIRPVRDAF